MQFKKSAWILGVKGLNPDTLFICYRTMENFLDGKVIKEDFIRANLT